MATHRKLGQLSVREQVSEQSKKASNNTIENRQNIYRHTHTPENKPKNGNRNSPQNHLKCVELIMYR